MEGSTSNGRFCDPEREPFHDAANIIEVKTVALDKFFKDVERIDIIKIDIEGAEILAWRGMEQLIRRHRPIIFVEYNPILLQAVTQEPPDTLLRHIRSADYEISILDCARGKRPSMRTDAEIVQAVEAVGNTHLDLMLTPIPVV